MSLPELSQETSATVQVIPMLGRDGGELTVVIVKQRFSISPRGIVARQPGAKVRMVDDPWDPDEPLSSPRLPSDLCAFKPGTDVIVSGEAMARDARPAPHFDVLMRAGPLEKIVRAFGPRVFYRGVSGIVLTAPDACERVPLKWELAFGGSDLSNPKKPAHEPRNPVGRGMATDPETLIHKPGPQIEDPRFPIDIRSRPVPVGLASIPPQFEPRSKLAGTMDDRWQTERMPLPPLDFDDRHNQLAPPDQIVPGFLRGGEPFQLANVSRDGILFGQFPRIVFGALAVNDMRQRGEFRPVLDTVIFEPNNARMDLVWRTAVPNGRHQYAVREILVYEKERLA